jgi:hypothetical protein
MGRAQFGGDETNQKTADIWENAQTADNHLVELRGTKIMLTQAEGS